MALIKCTECSREVSDKATNCPGCGAPIAAAPAASKPQRVKTSEDNVLTRSRGCADLFLIVIGLLVVFVVFIALR